VKYTQSQIDTIQSSLDPIPYRTLEESYDDLLNGDGFVSIAGYNYLPSVALYAVDRIAYNQGFCDYLGTDDNLVEIDGEYYRLDEIEALIESLLEEVAK
jgi:hypothetical protein